MFETSSFVVHFTLDQTGILFGGITRYLGDSALCSDEDKTTKQENDKVNKLKDSSKTDSLTQILYNVLECTLP